MTTATNYDSEADQETGFLEVIVDNICGMDPADLRAYSDRMEEASDKLCAKLAIMEDRYAGPDNDPPETGLLPGQGKEARNQETVGSCGDYQASGNRPFDRREVGQANAPAGVHRRSGSPA